MRRVPPPPPGFVLNEPRRAAVPAPPPGFVVDGSEPEPAPLKESIADKLWGAVSGAQQRIGKAIKGNATENLPSIMSGDFAKLTGSNPAKINSAAFRQLPSAIFGTDQDLGRSAAAQVQGAITDTDAAGNPVVQTPGGQRFYANKPGLDSDDALRFGANAVSYIPAARAALAVPTLASRAAAMGVGAGVTNVAGQAAGRDEIDPAEAALVTAFGAGGEIVGPMYRKVFETAKRVTGRAPPPVEVGRQLAARLGMDTAGMSRKRLEELAGLAEQQSAGASSAAVAGEAEFGLRYTQGQKTGDFAQLSREESMRQGMTPSADQFRGVTTQNRDTVERTVGDLTTKYGGGQLPTSPADSFSRTQGAVQRQADDLSAQVDAAYEGVRTSAKTDRANASINNFKGLPNRLQAALSEMPVGAGLTPATDAIVQRIGGKIANLPQGTKAIDLRVLDTERRVINQAMGSAANPTDKRALTILKREYDSWMDDTYANALSSDKLLSLREAQSLRASYGYRFEGKGADAAMDNFVESLVSGGKNPDELINVAFGMSQVSKPAAARYVARIKQAVGDSPEALDGLRSAHFQKLTTGKNGEVLGIQALRNNILSTDRNAPALLRELYTPQEWAQVRRFAGALEPLMAKGDFARSAGTAERMLRMVNTGRMLPVVGKMIDNIMERMQANGAIGAMRPVRAPLRRDLLLPAASAAIPSGG